MKKQGKEGKRDGGDIEAMDISLRHVATAGAVDKELHLEASPGVPAQTGLVIVERKTSHRSERLVEVERRIRRSLVQGKVDIKGFQGVINPQCTLVDRKSPPANQEA